MYSKTCAHTHAHRVKLTRTFSQLLPLFLLSLSKSSSLWSTHLQERVVQTTKPIFAHSQSTPVPQDGINLTIQYTCKIHVFMYNNRTSFLNIEVLCHLSLVHLSHMLPPSQGFKLTSNTLWSAFSNANTSLLPMYFEAGSNMAL